MIDSKFITLSKLDVAKRQLEHAINIFFRNGDTVVIHSLTSAAYQILRDLARKQNVKSVTYDEAMQYIKPEKRDEIKKKFSEAKNYFKHADNDSDKQLNFYYQATQFDIWDACIIYARLTNETIPLFALFVIWFYLNNPSIISDKAKENQVIKIAKTISPENRSQFLDILPEIESKLLK